MFQQIFFKELKQLVVQSNPEFYRIHDQEFDFFRDDISLSSEDLERIGKYYEKQKSMSKNRGDITRKTMRKIPIEAQNMKMLFFKTLDKLQQIKHEKKSMEDKIEYLQSALEFKEVMFNQLQVIQNQH